MPFGASMDAWASYYDYQSDEIEVDDAVGSARASSELDFTETHRKSGHLGEIRLESLPPSSVPNAQLQPIDELYSQLFPVAQQHPSQQHDTLKTTTDSAPLNPAEDRISTRTDSCSARQASVNPLGPSGRAEETFSYNATPPLALIERRMAKTWIGLTWGEIKLLSLAGAGFLVDAYDLFVINMIYPLLLLAYYPPGTRNIEWGLSGGVLKASASMGNVIGQLLFGFLGDFWGRSVLYGKELMLAMAAIVLIISAPDSIHGMGVTIWMAVFRFMLGLAVGADYPCTDIPQGYPCTGSRQGYPCALASIRQVVACTRA
ncbi:uncharacterized protein PSANT_00038 [Moesziomyces antarcticus]|uniref:Major facilitator superfamily (MFS) profile domain-containing protein n=1 Tax=Pseudozyma antarctica TaxID=84753 RepID=A0A5C3FFA1_PSEA2|nr:uncharacterized protein PSANT_00038 [Moesziomyces antarcticus]